MKEILENTTCLSLEEIQNYAKGRLDEAARFRVESHVLDCVLCRAALESYLANPDETVGADLALLQQQIANRTTPQVTLMQKSRFNYVAAAIVLLLLAIAAIVYWQHTRYDRLYVAFFTAPDADASILLRGELGSPAADPEYLAAMKWYKTGDYAAATPHFDNYLARHPDDFQTRLYAGITVLNSGYPEKAVEELTTVSINDPTLFDEASWYLALAFLKQKNPDEAVAILKNLSERAEPVFAAKAKQLLERME